MTRSSGPRKVLLLASSMISVVMDFVPTLWKGAPTDVLLYVVTVLLLGTLLLIGTTLKLLIFLCKCFAEPKFGDVSVLCALLCAYRVTVRPYICHKQLGTPVEDCG